MQNSRTYGIRDHLELLMHKVLKSLWRELMRSQPQATGHQPDSLNKEPKQA